MDQLQILKATINKRMKWINKTRGRYNAQEVELYRVLQLIDELEETGEIKESSLVGLGSLPAGWYERDHAD